MSIENQREFTSSHVSEGSFPTRGKTRERIRVLADGLVDQIAAGEVVERPASVVKELVENSLDAGAGRVRVEVRQGGGQWLAVTDDGCGMAPEDARCSLRRHATSKIAHSEDLEAIQSFGFRGEALPAIASVSRLRLLTRAEGQPEATEIRVEAGIVTEERSTGAPPGTRVEVADLFANVPARRKFLKRPSTEWGHIADWLHRFALVWPGVHFEVRNDDRPALIWPPTTDRLDRIAAVISENEAAALLHFEGESPVGHLEAFVSPPEQTRPNGNGIYLYVNARPVRDRLLRHALLQVYRDWLPRARFPTAILLLTIPFDAADVNVHPAKWEVRFADPQAIHQLVRGVLRDGMAQRGWLGGGQPAAAAVAGSTGTALGPGAGRADGAAETKTGRPQTPTASRVAEPGLGDWLFAGRETTDVLNTASAREAEQPRLRFSGLRLVGQLLATYLLLESKSGLVVVDQHAAHERVLYERLRSEWLARGVESQGLLEPLSVELEPLAASALRQASERVERLGFRLEGFGDAAIVLRGIPALLAGRDPVALLRDLARELEAAGAAPAAGHAEVRMLEAADRLFAGLACHAARRAGDHLEHAEQRALLDALDEIPWAPTCPHGRPVAIALDGAEIERRFGRR